MELRNWDDIRARLLEQPRSAEMQISARKRTDEFIDGYRLKERRRNLRLTQSDLAKRMGVTKGRVSQIENGEVATVESVARYVEALGGTLSLVATFEDELVFLRGTDPIPSAA